MLESLGILIADLKGRIEDYLVGQNIDSGCVHKLFVVWPKSCTTEYPLEGQ